MSSPLKARYAKALRAIIAIDDQQNDYGGFSPDYWFAVALCADIARSAFADEAKEDE